MRRADSALYEAKTMGRNCVASDAGRPQDSLPRFVRARDKAPH